jgi:hypothetical protein
VPLVYETNQSRLPLSPAPARPGLPACLQPIPLYPGATETMSAPVAEILSSMAANADQSRRLSPSQRLQFIRQLNEMVPREFNMLLFAVSPPPGLIPPMPAPQADRTSALLTWAESRGGCGLSVLQQLLARYHRNANAVNPSHSDRSVASPLAPDREITRDFMVGCWQVGRQSRLDFFEDGRFTGFAAEHPGATPMNLPVSGSWT